jgi:voltage-gated potassium channel
LTPDTRPEEEREELRERLAGWMEGPLNALALAALVTLIVEFAVRLPPHWEWRLASINWFIYAVFTAHFAVQVALAPSKALYLRRHWLAALSVLLPAARAFRALRALRAVRALRLVRVVTATNRGARALSRMLRGNQFGRVLGLTVAVVAVGAAALMYFETDAPRFGARYGDALWWATALVTTVGSDFQPSTLEGRVITLLLIVWGLGVFGYVTGAVASYFVGQDASGATDTATAELQGLRAELAELRALLAETRERPQP